MLIKNTYLNIGKHGINSDISKPKEIFTSEWKTSCQDDKSLDDDRSKSPRKI